MRHTGRKDTQQANATGATILHTTRRLAGMHRNNRTDAQLASRMAAMRAHTTHSPAGIHSRPTQQKRRCGIRSIGSRECTATIADAQQASRIEAAMRHTAHRLAGMHRNNRGGCTTGQPDGGDAAHTAHRPAGIDRTTRAPQACRPLLRDYELIQVYACPYAYRKGVNGHHMPAGPRNMRKHTQDARVRTVPTGSMSGRKRLDYADTASLVCRPLPRVNWLD